MKRLVFSVLFLMASSTFAQQPDTTRVIVQYKFTYLRDTTDRAHPYTENLALFVGKRASTYRSYDAMVANEQNEKAYAEALAASTDGHVSIRRVSAGSPTEYYQFPNAHKLITKDKLVMNTYLIEEPMPTIHWKLNGDTTTFGSLHCQKATGHFMGRDYTVWFCPDLPVHTGPWKLNGLPGLIVDAHDAKNEVVFRFDGIKKPILSPQKSQRAANVSPSGQGSSAMLQDSEDDPNLIEPPALGIKTTSKEFEKLKETMYKDPNAFAQMLMAQQGGNIPGNGPKPDGIRIKVGPGPVINNPIELPEK